MDAQMEFTDDFDDTARFRASLKDQPESGAHALQMISRMTLDHGFAPN
jgi:hypothetical protein